MYNNFNSTISQRVYSVFCILVFGYSIFLLTGCNAPKYKDNAMKVVDSMFFCISVEQLTNIEDFYSDTFFENKSKELWKEQLAKQIDAFGGFIYSENISWKVKKYPDAYPFDIGVILVYVVHYKNINVREFFTLHLTKNKEFKISEHRYLPLKENNH